MYMGTRELLVTVGMMIATFLFAFLTTLALTP